MTFFASVTFDGNLKVVPQTVASSSPLGSFQYGGTYTVNLNCTGTLTLAAPPKNSPEPLTSVTPLVTANFVLIPPVAYVSNGTTTLSGSADRPSLLFSTSNSTQILSGYGRAQ